MKIKNLFLSFFILALSSCAFSQVVPTPQPTPSTLLDEKFIVTDKQAIERIFLIKQTSNVNVELNVLNDDKPVSENVQLGLVKLGGEYYKKGKPINVVLMSKDNYLKMKAGDRSAGLTLENFSKQSTIGFNAQDSFKAGEYVFVFFFPKKSILTKKSTVSLKLTTQASQ